MCRTFTQEKTLNLLTFIAVLMLTSGCFLNAKIEGLSSNSSSGSDPSNNISVPTTLVPDPFNEKVTNSFSQEGQLTWDLPSPAVQSFKVVVSKTAAPEEKCTSADALSVSTLSANFSNLDSDTNYYFRICSVDTSGQVSNGVTGSFKTMKYIQRSPAYPSYANWNDYLLNNGSKYYNANQTVCPGNSTSGFNSCINGGLVQKLTLPTLVSCDRITIYDKLKVFKWNCDDSSGTTIIYSSDLNSFKGLQDLISDYQFKDNLVIVKVDGVETYSSIAEKWWTNPIEELPDSPAGGTITLTNSGSSAGKVFIATTSKSGGGYVISENKISIVTKKDVELKKDSNTATSLLSASVAWISFLWVEGKFNGNGLGGGGALLNFPAILHPRFHNIEISNNQNTLLGLSASMNAIVSDFNFHHCSIGIGGGGSGSGFLVRNGTVSHCSNNFVAQVYYSVVHNIVFSSNESSVVGDNLIFYPFNSIHTNLTFVNNKLTYMFRFFAGNYALVHNILNSNSADRTMYAWNSAFLTISQFFSFGANISDIAVSNTTGEHKFTNNLVLSSGAGCSINNNTANNPGLVNGTCANSGTKSNAVFTAVAADESKFFVGKVTSTDTSNTNNSFGLSAISQILDWFHFENTYRIWGIDGGSFPNANNRGNCTSGNCRIWDYRLKADANNYAHNSTESVTVKNANFVPGAACPSAISGNKVTTYTNSTPTIYTYLTNAMEIIGDGIGNDNSLCESGESCIYTPNFGAYQGEGDYLSQGTCVFQNGTVSNVKMYAYPTNGI